MSAPPNTPQAFLMLAYGGPEGLDDVWPFLRTVTGGRVPDARLQEVAGHYEHFNGVSPLTALTKLQFAALKKSLTTRGHALAGYLGMRFWHPFLKDTLAEMQAAGITNAVAIIMAAQQSESSWECYQEEVRAALDALDYPLTISYTAPIFDHPGFIAAVAAQIQHSLAAIPEAERAAAQLLFTAHSIPLDDPFVSRYAAQLESCAGAVAGSLGITNWRLVYQSRSGRPSDPWLEPDVSEAIREAAAAGSTHIVAQPIGFVCDHIEVLFDLDVEATATAQEIGVTFHRAKTPNDDALYIEALTDRVADLLR